MPRIDTDIKLDFKDVLLRPKRSTLRSRSDVILDRTITFRNSKRTWTGVPLIASNMDTVGTFEMAKALTEAEAGKSAGTAGLFETGTVPVKPENMHKCFTTMHKHYTLEEWKNFAQQNPEALDFVAASSGTSDSDWEKLTQILNEIPQVKTICLDVANGYSEHFVEYLRKTRKMFPEHTILSGNVVTGEMVEELILSGADVIKVGIGPGSVCTTRNKTGVGYPQVSAVLECADAAHGLGGHIISDGGCTNPGDIAKAFGAGADFVMMGGMLAGHDQSGGEIFEKNGKKFKIFYGMSSATAMKKHAGGVAEYRASEGKTVDIPYRGDVKDTILDIKGGLRSACTYTGAGKLKELPKRTTFIRVTQQTNQIFQSMGAEGKQ